MFTKRSLHLQDKGQHGLICNTAITDMQYSHFFYVMGIRLSIEQQKTGRVWYDSKTLMRLNPVNNCRSDMVFFNEDLLLVEKGKGHYWFCF